MRAFGRPLPARRLWHEWPLALVLVCSLVSFGILVTRDFRWGAVSFGASLLLAMVLRLVLGDSRAGLLTVRSRVLDVLTLGALGVTTLVLAAVVPPPT